MTPAFRANQFNGVVANVPSSSATRSNSTPSAHSSNEPEGMYKSHCDDQDFFPIGRRGLLCSNHLGSPITEPITKMGVAHTFQQRA